MKEIPVLFSNEADCCGCTACFSICTADAITMKEDEKGFFYPFVDEYKCIRCYRCIKVCPIDKDNK